MIDRTTLMTLNLFSTTCFDDIEFPVYTIMRYIQIQFRQSTAFGSARCAVFYFSIDYLPNQF